VGFDLSQRLRFFPLCVNISKKIMLRNFEFIFEYKNPKAMVERGGENQINQLKNKAIYFTFILGYKKS